MQLTLYRNNVAVDLPPFWAGADFYYADGKIGITAQDGWEYTQQLLEEGPDGEAVVVGTVNWSVSALPVDEPIPPTPEQIRAAMPTLAPTEFAALLAGLRTPTWPNGVLPSDIVTLIETHIPAGRDRELALWAWNRSQYFERLNPLIDQIGALLGLTPEEIDIAWMAFVGASE